MLYYILSCFVNSAISAPRGSHSNKRSKNSVTDENTIAGTQSCAAIAVLQSEEVRTTFYYNCYVLEEGKGCLIISDPLSERRKGITALEDI